MADDDALRMCKQSFGASPELQIEVRTYARTGVVQTAPFLLDAFCRELKMPSLDAAEVGISRAASLFAEYLAWDPIWQKPRMSIAAAHDHAGAFLAMFSDPIRTFVDSEIAKRGIAVARNRWGFEWFVFDDSSIGGMWIVDED